MHVFVEFSSLIVLAALIGGLMKLLKQPLMMGHIITGVLVGPQFLNLFKDVETGEVFSLFGISILLFIVGLSLSPRIIREVGKVSLITGIGQVLFTTLFGFLIAQAFGFGLVPSIYIAIALTFSSTIIILKLLSDKKDLESLYGRISIGFLLVQDVVATLILIAVSSFSSGEAIIETALLVIIKGLAATLVLSLISYYVLPKLSTFFAKSQEFLFLFAIGWGLGLATAFEFLGFSVEIGALIAGVTLSMSPYAEEISNRLKPLRDFFIIMFFILLGANMNFDHLGSLLLPALIFSAFVLIGNPLIVMTLMGLLGYNKKTGFMAGLTVAQISEFSLILITLGLKLGHVSEGVMSLVTLVGLVTIAASTYLIMYSNNIFHTIGKYLSIFEKKRVIPERSIISDYDVILFGCNRAGYDFIETFKYLGPKFLAVDFDPEIVAELQDKGINVKFGDAEDAEFLEEINVYEAKVVISTVSEFETNRFILNKTLEGGPRSTIMLTSKNVDNAIELYEIGADYVIVPHFIGGQVASQIAHSVVFGLQNVDETKNDHLEYLRRRKALGHASPF